jgi:hypothetical protein
VYDRTIGGCLLRRAGADHHPHATRTGHRPHRLQRSVPWPAQWPLECGPRNGPQDFRNITTRFHGDNLETSLQLVRLWDRSSSAWASQLPSSPSPGWWPRATRSCRCSGHAPAKGCRIPWRHRDPARRRSPRRDRTCNPQGRGHRRLLRVVPHGRPRQRAHERVIGPAWRRGQPNS